LMFEAVAMYQISMCVIGDFNVCFDPSRRLNTSQLLDLIQSFGFGVRPTAATHRDGGPIDTVITRQNISSPLVQTVGVKLSDHHQLEWSVST
jgi:hypothetical protein